MISDLVECTKALGDKTRLEILYACRSQWRSVREIVHQVNVSQPTVSHHLAALLKLGLVKAQTKGRFTLYLLNQERLRQYCHDLLNSFT
ncbi:MAG: metalloregulator ArsR/SmtB family transcription factor [Chloroflexota bacterium]